MEKYANPIRLFANLSDDWRIGKRYLSRSADLYSPIRQFADDIAFSE